MKGNRHMRRYVGKRMRSARTVAGLTHLQVAQAMDIGISQISRWETGGHLPSIPSLCHYAIVCGVDPSILLGGKDAWKVLLSS